MPVTTRPNLSNPVTTPEGFKIPPEFTVEVRNEPTLDFDIDLVGRYVDGRYVAETVTIRPEVTGERLRKVKVGALLYHGAVAATSGCVPPIEELRPLRAEGPTDRVLELVGRVYRVAMICGYPQPVRDVEHAFGVPRPTASRWVGLARERGFLGPAEPGRAGERKRKGKT